MAIADITTVLIQRKTDQQYKQSFVMAVDCKIIFNAIWGDDSYFNSRNLDVYIRKLREHFKDDSTISSITLKGKGYLFSVQ